MSNDDLRGLESLDRRHESTTTTRVPTDGSKPTTGSRSSSNFYTDGGTTENTIRERLELITELTRSVLADVQNIDGTTALEDIDEETRRNAKRRLREIDAETRRVGLELFGPELSLPDRKDTESTDDVPEVVRSDSFTTSYLGPEPGAFQRVQEDRSPKRETDTQDDPNHSDGDRDE